MKLTFEFTDIYCPEEVPVRGRKASVSYVLLVCYVITKMLNTRMPNEVKMTPLDRLLVHIFSLACFQGKSSRDFSSFVGPNTLLEWREF